VLSPLFKRSLPAGRQGLGRSCVLVATTLPQPLPYKGRGARLLYVTYSLVSFYKKICPKN